MAKSKKFDSEEISGFCSQVAIMLKSGIGLAEGMDMLEKEMEDESTKHILENIKDRLDQNGSFHGALKKTDAFPEYLVNMVRIGEESGKLEDVMCSMEQYYSRDSIIKESIRNVIAYPTMMFLMIAVILVALVTKILPMFENVFVNLNVEAASTSSKLMNFGMLAGKVVAIFAVVVLVIGLVLYGVYHTQGGKKALKGFVCKFFMTKKTARLLAVGRFVSSMDVMISSGMDAQEAMALSKKIVEHPVVEKQVENCIEKMSKEETFSNALRDENILTGMQGRMVSVAEKSGLLDDVLGDISQQYDDKIENHMGQFCTKLETALVLSLSIIVGGVLISVMFPMVSIITSIG